MLDQSRADPALSELFLQLREGLFYSHRMDQMRLLGIRVEYLITKVAALGKAGSSIGALVQDISLGNRPDNTGIGGGKDLVQHSVVV